MTLVVVLLLLALLLGGIGFAAHLVWIVAVVVLVACGILYIGSRR